MEKEHEISCHDRGWLSDRINELRNGIQLALPEVIKTLDELSTSTDDKSYEAAAYCMKRSLGQLCSFLQIPTVEFGEVWKEKTNWEWLTIGVEKLDEALKRRLLLLPECLEIW